MVGRSRYQAFSIVKDRVWKKLSNWKNQFLSPSGKEVLIKAVIQAIPAYYMSVFKLPKKLSDEIASLMAKFWWGFKQRENRIQWRSWAKMGWSKNDGGLGFRELEAFNQALLAKQCWRVMMKPHSMAVVMLKEKYFRHTDLLHAPLGFRPSVIWRSLWNARDLLREGLVWRVGDGRSIKIWKDKWVPRAITFKIQSSISILHAEAKVEQLISVEKKEWNVELVKEVMNEEEAEIISKLPISLSGLPDKQIWAYSKNALYTVRSAYHVEINRRRRERGEMSNKSGEVWRKVWLLNIPRVVKVFVWKTMLNCLPTKMNLMKRSVVKEATCPVCMNENETVCHALWSCRGQGMYGLVRGVQCINGRVGRGICLSSGQTDFQLAQVKQTSKANSGVPISNKATHWKPPMGEILKVNWDATWKAKEDRSGIGVVIRDSSGEIVASLCCPRTKVQDAMVAEVYALWRAMKLCVELNFKKVQFEGDALSVVKAVNSSEECWERHGQVVEDLKDALRKRIGWAVVHVDRCCNNVAHSLAKIALSIQEERVWMEDYPKEILKCEEAASVNMETRMVAMEQLVEKLTNEMNVLCEKSQALKDDNQDSAHHGDPSANEHQESRQEEGGDNDQEERKHMQDELYNLRGKYEEIIRRMGSSSIVDQLLVRMGLPYSAKGSGLQGLPVDVERTSDRCKTASAQCSPDPIGPNAAQRLIR
ncbi:uncharacterized protein LOC122290063 [Carya illinoinensis]|uniref:uncharacterized protein LOC122290063 n=1 Tax=Carya illinoinensis TaxID=32201 RepID=UPI001C717DD5|nr:uncharacterized protein LOC122290063 [Carya illinoinensis]